MSLRERKKALTRTTIEDTGLRLFTEQGYDATTLDDICEAALVSRRTFFRYFSSKEDVVLSASHEEFTQAADQLRHRPPDEPVRESLTALVRERTAAIVANRDTQLLRGGLLSRTPTLAGSYLKVLTGFEHLLRDFVAERTGEATTDPRVRLIAAATVTAFRVSTETWVEDGGTIDLETLALHNLDLLTRAM